ncbi:MAG: transcription antitermination factor NusB [Lachnospiraceae bacterium]|jgi:N utilization substance protein B|nr:transcription antitermination factor NusB [Lachnospiraceae bacterium]
MNRRELRENTFKFLFCIDFHSEEEWEGQINLFLNSFELEEVEPEEKEKFRIRTLDIIDKISELDKKIEEVTQGWKKNRIGKAELTIIRLAFYEMKYDEDVPVSVAINEAVELSKKFGGEDSAGFVNGILAKMV